MIVFLLCAGCICLLILLYLFLIAPRLFRKPNMAPLLSSRYAHRGLHGKTTGFPENSLGAFRLAVEKGYGIELDVHLTKDGRLAVMHDESLKRTCGVEKNIGDLTLEELSSYRLEGTEEPIPSLEQVLELVNGKVPLIVELKPTSSNIQSLARAVTALLSSYTGEYCNQSFDPRILMWYKRHFPACIRGQLSMDFRKRDGLSFPIRFVLRNLLTNCLTRPDFIAYRYEDRNKLSPRLLRKLFHCQEFSWTVISFSQQKTAEKDGARIIFEQYDPAESEKK